jgi:glutathione S-transferase
MLRIWGRINSTNVKKVVWCAQELHLEFERIDAGGTFGIVNTPEFLQLNPNGRIPVLQVGDFVLWESNAIVRYLAAQYGAGSLYPDDLQQRADADRWMDWQATTFAPAITPAFLNLVRTPPDQRDQQAIEASRLKTESLAEILDRQLQSREYLTGETFTMADIAVGCNVHNWINLPLTRIERPNLQRWYTNVSARAASANVLTLPLS